MYMYVYVCICIYRERCVCVCEYRCMCVCVCVCVCVCMKHSQRDRSRAPLTARTRFSTHELGSALTNWFSTHELGSSSPHHPDVYRERCVCVYIDVCVCVCVFSTHTADRTNRCSTHELGSGLTGRSRDQCSRRTADFTQVCSKRPITVSKETYYSVKRDLLINAAGAPLTSATRFIICQKRPTIGAKETY